MAIVRGFFSATANVEQPFGTIPLEPKRTRKREITNGVVAGTGDVFCLYSGTAGTGGTTLNLRDSTLTQLDKTAAVFVKLTDVYIEIDEAEADAGYLIIGGGTNPVPFSGYAEPFFHFSVDSGVAITASSNDRLKIASSVGTLTFNVFLVGRSS